jgi:glycerol-3-phosphate acyltransferase PlsX
VGGDDNGEWDVYNSVTYQVRNNTLPYRQTIALDAMGGDHGPDVIVPAASLALQELPGVHFLLFGDERRIQPILARYPLLAQASTIRHTEKVIGNHEKPSQAIRSGKDSSMRLAIEAVKSGEAQSVVSGGNTGALMAMSKLILKSLPGISRPAIAAVFPTMRGKTVMLDLGANIMCDAEILVQFALLGAVYARTQMGVEKPTIGLLNIGSEEMKGHDQLRAAASILSNVEIPGKYHGFVEGNDIGEGTVDVVVTDGFTGNVALKVAEGVARLMNTKMKAAFTSSWLTKLGAMLAMPALKSMKKQLDHRYYNGGVFMGLDGICVKSHGSMDEIGFANAIKVAAGLVEQNFNKQVAAELEHLMSQESFITSMSAQANA